MKEKLKGSYKLWRENNANVEKTVTAIKKAKMFVCCITKSYLQSSICQKEFKYAYKLRKNIMVLFLENIKMNEICMIDIGLSSFKFNVKCYEQSNNSEWAEANLPKIFTGIERIFQVILNFKRFKSS